MTISQLDMMDVGASGIQIMGAQIVSVYPAKPYNDSRTGMTKYNQNFIAADNTGKKTFRYPFIEDFGLTLNNSHIGAIINFKVDVDQYNGKKQFIAKFDNNSMPASPPTAPQTPQNAPGSTNSPPVVSQPQSRPANVQSVQSVQSVQDWDAKDRAKQLSIERQCASKVAAVLVNPLYGQGNWDMGNVIDLAEQLISYYRNGPPNTGAGVNTYEEENPDEEIPF